ALTVVVVHADEVEPEARITADGPGAVARQQIDFAGLERGEALLRRERGVAHLGRIAEHGGRHGSTHIDVDAAPNALGVRRREAGDARADAALHVALGAYRVESRLRSRRH